MNKDKISEYCLYFWLLIWPWQTKLILRGAPVNYLEISFFISWLLLFVPLLFWSRRIFFEDYLKFKKELIRPSWWWGLIIWELVTFFSIFWAEDKILALFRYLVLASGIFLFYIVKRSDFIKVKKVVNFLILGLLSPAVLGIWQFLAQRTWECKYLGLASHAADILGTGVIETSSGRFLRAYGSFDHPNVLGGLMAIALILVLYISLKKEITRKYRIFYLVSFSIFLSALLFSFSRTAILALLAGALFIIINAWRLGDFQKKLIALYIFLSIFVSAIIIIPNINLFSVRVSAQSRLEQKSLIERQSYLSQAASIIKERSLTGVGVGNYILAEKKLDNSQHDFWYYQPVHNYWLLAWSEIGLFGFLGVLVFWLSLIKMRGNKYLWPLALSLFILSLLDHWLWTWPLGLMIFFVLAAILIREDV